MDLVHAIVLALIQGITEFLPISSSAHLVLPSILFGWQDQGLAFDTAVHLGSLLAVIIFFREDLVRLTRAGLGHVAGNRTPDGTYAFNLVIASLPILPIGFLSRFYVEDELRSIEVIAATTILFALALWFADHYKKEQSTELTTRKALLIGIAQCLALIPGTSRSGITMTAALLTGFTRTESARIAFLISIPTILGAATLKLWDITHSPAPVDWLAITIGSVLAAISAYACISLLLNFIERIGYLPFVIYRLIIGIFLIFLISGVL